jgi:hypothetical protein
LARTIVGQLVVNLIDGVTGKAKGIAAAIKAIENSVTGLGKVNVKGGGVDGLATSLKNAEKAARDLAATGKGLDDWGSRFSGNLGRLRATPGEIDKIRDSWRRLQGDMRGGRLDEAFRVNAVRQWQASAIAGLAAVRREHEKTERAITAASVSRLGRNAAIVAGAVPTAYGAQRATRYGLTHGAELPRETTRQFLGGMTPEEQATAAIKARELSTRFPSIGQVGAMEHIRQLRARFGDFPHAIDGVESLVRAQVILQNLKGGEQAGHDLERLVLGLEGLGAGADPKKFKQYLDAFVKAKSLFPDLRGEDFRQYLQTSKASKYGLSDDYLTNVAPTMMQHEGAAKFGTMQQTAFGALVGLRTRKRSVEQLIEHGLAEKWHKNARGEVLLDKIVGEQDLISNPFKWATEVLAPALEKKGVSFTGDKEKFVSTVTKMFSDRNAAEFFTTLLANKSVIEKDRAMLATARGTESAEEVRVRDPFVAFDGVKQQLINVVQNALEPQAARATAALNSVADALGRLAAINLSQTGWFKEPAKQFMQDVSDTSLTKILFKPFEAWKLLLGADKAWWSMATEGQSNWGGRSKRPPEDFTFASTGRFRGGAAAPSDTGLFNVPAAAPGRFPNLPMFQAPIQPFDLSATAGSTMDSYNEVLRAKGEEAKGIGASIASALRSLLSFTATPNIQMPSVPGAPAAATGTPSAPARASGGSVYAGQLYQVSEHGPELFVPGTDGSIVPDPGGAGGGSAAGGRSVSVSFGEMHFHGVHDTAAVASSVVGTLNDKVNDEIRSLFSDYGVEVV